MPYDPGSQIVGDPQFDAQGRPYWPTASGGKSYISGPEAQSLSTTFSADYRTPEQRTLASKLKSWGDANQPNRGGFTTGNPTWNADTGEYHNNFFNTPLGGAVLGGAAFGAPLAASALLGSGAAGASTGALPAVQSVAPGALMPAVGEAAGGVLPSTTIGTGMGALATGVPSGTGFASQFGGLMADAAGATPSGGNTFTGALKSLFGGGGTSDLIRAGIGAATSIYGANKEAGAAEDAARIQAASFDKALAAQKEQQDYERGQRAQFLTSAQPYVAGGTAADARLRALLGL
jgi:hypothetical protein